MWPAAAVAIALAAANLYVLRAHLGPHNEALREYRDVAARVPAGEAVMPVATRPRDGDTRPFLHAGMFATIEAGARIPYMFAGGVTPYFTVRRRLDAPPISWYERGDPVPDGPAIAETYRFLLVTKPFDRSRIPVSFEVLAQNEAAALLRVVR